MSKRIDLTGRRFGYLTVIGYAGTHNGRAKWHCRCDCGKEKDVFSTNLLQRTSQSCGCMVQRDGGMLNGGKYEEKRRKAHDELTRRYYCCGTV